MNMIVFMMRNKIPLKKLYAKKRFPKILLNAKDTQYMFLNSALKIRLFITN